MNNQPNKLINKWKVNESMNNQPNKWINYSFYSPFEQPWSSVWSCGMGPDYNDSKLQTTTDVM